MRRAGALALCGMLVLLAACGSGSDGSGGGGGTPVAAPVVDVAVLGEDNGTDAVHLYRDVLRLPSSGAAPDRRIAPPTDVASIAFTGTHLVLAQDLGVPNQNRLFVYTPADLAASPVGMPSVQVFLPPPAGTTAVSIRGLVVHDDDVYVLSLYNDGAFPNTGYELVTHVFRDLSTLAGGAAPDAVITHAQLTMSGIFQESDSLALDDDVLLATAFGTVYLNLDPASLAGNEVPDRSLDMAADLSLTGGGWVYLGGGQAFFFGPLYIAGFDDPAGLVAGRTPRFELSAPSLAVPSKNAITYVGGRLFSQGAATVYPYPVLGFDVDGPVLDNAPPDVVPAPLATNVNVRVDGAADTLVSALSPVGAIHVYAGASTLADGDEPDVSLWDAEIFTVRQVRAVAR